MKARKLAPYVPLDADRAEGYALKFQKMIACPTVSVKGSHDDTEFAKFRDLVAALFPLIHKNCEKMLFGDGCLVYKLKGKDESRNMMLMSHHDVVAATEKENWDYPPFEGRIADGKVWGRGTQDTKGSLFGELEALEQLLERGFMPVCNVWIASSCNEETGGNGVPEALKWFQTQGITFEVVLDEGGAVIDPPIGGMNCQKCAMVAIHEKGIHDLILTAETASSHGSLTSGTKATPTERMAAFVTEVCKKPPFIRRINDQVRGMFEAMAPYAGAPMKLVLGNSRLFEPLLVKILPKLSAQAGGLIGTTCMFNDIVSSEKGLLCTAKVTLRSVDDADVAVDIENFKKVAEKYGITVTLGDRQEYHAPADPTLPPFEILSKCVHEIYPDAPVVPYILPAGTDARTLTDVCRCVLRFAPIRMSKEQLGSIHTRNENIDVSALASCVAFYRRFLEYYEEETV